jgi:hypothetical protein
MIKCILLIPLRYNDGTEVAGPIISQALDEIYDRFGGYSILGTVRGAYRMAGGKRADDVSLQVQVALERDQVLVLEAMVARFAKVLKQESMWFEVTESDVRLVKPEPESEEHDG